MIIDFGKLAKLSLNVELDSLEKIMTEIDHAMTEVDLILWTWQTDLDMMSFIGQNIPVKVYEPAPKDVDMKYNRIPALHIKAQADGNWEEIPPPAEPEKIVTRVPLVKYEGSKRIVIGIADVDESNGVMKAEVFEDHKDIFGIPGSDAFSIMDEDPPVLDHTAIKKQLRDLISPELYVNPFKIQGVTDATPDPGLVRGILNLSQTKNSIKGLFPDLDNHPFFKE